MQDPLDISHDVSTALNRNEPIVALESSVIAQGLPSPVNVETAMAMEENVKKAGAVPATIGIIDGVIKVGLSKEEIETLGKGTAAKIAVRDLPYAAARKLNGGTTVSATARIAASSGIFVMATGGIGGIHRGYAKTLDASADLWELARTPVVVVCSGAKAVLDVPATLEWLESHSVPVYGYNTDDFPMFYSQKSGICVPKLENASDVAELLKTAGKISGARCATLIGVPIPKCSEINVSKEIEEALAEAENKKIKSKELTPFLLNKVAELSSGKSIDANISLLKNNASVASEIATSLYENTQRRMGFVI